VPGLLRALNSENAKKRSAKTKREKLKSEKRKSSNEKARSEKANAKTIEKQREAERRTKAALTSKKARFQRNPPSRTAGPGPRPDTPKSALRL
jgi:hypothetical protein